jgi:formamidopyrimidine-DNA glycosylase
MSTIEHEYIPPSLLVNAYYPVNRVKYANSITTAAIRRKVNIMPELPEVETVSNALRPHLVGRAIARIIAGVEQMRTPITVHRRKDLIGSRIVQVHRRAKYILTELDLPGALMTHLGMTGSCRVVPCREPRLNHEHIIVELDDGMSWRLRDPRRFGMFEYHSISAPGELPECLDGLGPEPLESKFDTAYLLETCRQRQRPVKNHIMDNYCVVGVGNIYASEALHRARIHPKTPASRLSSARCRRLVATIRAVLEDAIAAGGTTISDFQTVDGSEGKFSRQLDVYDRAGESCRHCERTIRRTVMAGRSTFYCPGCQRW